MSDAIWLLITAAILTYVGIKDPQYRAWLFTAGTAVAITGVCILVIAAT